jgi:hypothetical protein
MTIWDEWKQQQLAKIKKPPKTKEPVVFRLITEDELKKMKKLARITPQPGSGDKRFLRQFEGVTAETRITDRQAGFIEILWYKYRRQLGHNGPRPAGYRTHRTH